ncbi:cytochrome P450 [Eremomyces bilateralis CBS 781.70]|uniref:Cytochrome P450 n=1 Tax=Eremomyces bilateralis CBS 781.70 TaxID=1392243 RepID=A0A6G1FXH7_9PEZI|nr:cytochrome P450 [Eremomyces bilateralis CBS 781.70]KAF1810537.1 cytochrome P450 [Eremomyces bilateralis CBS 781.70]
MTELLDRIPRPSSLVLVGVATGLFYYIGLFVYNAYLHPLAKFPGPKLRSATPFPNLYAALHGDQQFDYAALHGKYGPVVRIGPDALSYITGGAWREIYGHRPGKTHSQMPKDPVQYASQPGRAWSIINAPTIPIHSKIRRLLNPSFSEKSLRGQEPLITRYVDLLIDRLKDRVGQKSTNLTDWMNFITFDVIGDLAYGEPFGCLENVQMHPWIQLTFDFLKTFVYVQVLRFIPGALDLMNVLIPPKMRRSRDYHWALTAAKVQKRIAMETQRPDFMGHIIATMKDGDGLSVKEMEATSEVLIVAGSETTATLLTGCFYYLLKTPRAYRRLVEEIRGTFKEEKEIGYDRVNKCRYLLAVLDEALRIYPPVPTSMQRVVPGAGDYIEGQWVPGGTLVSVAPWAAYHSDRNFRDPDDFVPERFLGDEKYKDDRFDVLQPFSYGPRNCIGQNLAYLEMKLILARMIWNFDLTLLPESELWNQQKVYFLWMKPPLYVKLSLVERDGTTSG